jgi:soluble lytic murein transglycosylase-like protein
VQAEQYNTGKKLSIYTYKSAAGITAFSDIEPMNIDFHHYKVDCYACQLDSLINWRTARLYLTDFTKNIEQASLVNKVDTAFVRAIIHAESHFDPKAISKQGAQGLMQLMPETAEELGVKHPLNAQQNIEGGVKHLARLLKKYRGDKQLTAAAYNAGEGAIKKIRWHSALCRNTSVR